MNINIAEMSRMEQLRGVHLLGLQGLEGAVAFYEQIAKTYALEAASYGERANKDMEAVMAIASLVAGAQVTQLRRQFMSVTETSAA